MPATNGGLEYDNTAITAPANHYPPAALIEQHKPLILHRYQPKRKWSVSLHLIKHHISHLLKFLQSNTDEVLIIVDLFVLEYQWPAVAQHHLHP